MAKVYEVSTTLGVRNSDETKEPFLCAGFRLCHPEAAFGGLLDSLGMCPSVRTGLCGLVMLDIWMSRKESGVDGSKKKLG